jgi:hypothetical protein
MKKMIALSSTLAVLGVADVYQISAQANHQFFGAFITVGSRTVALPAQTRLGDRIVITSTTGARVFEQKINDNGFYLNMARFQPEINVLTVERNGAAIASMKVSSTRQ